MSRCFYCYVENRHLEHCLEEIPPGEERDQAFKAWARGVTAGNKWQMEKEPENPYYMLGYNNGVPNDQVMPAEADEALDRAKGFGSRVWKGIRIIRL